MIRKAITDFRGECIEKRNKGGRPSGKTEPYG
jgi:hypothetical protein